MAQLGLDIYLYPVSVSDRTKYEDFGTIIPLKHNSTLFRLILEERKKANNWRFRNPDEMEITRTAQEAYSVEFQGHEKA